MDTATNDITTVIAATITTAKPTEITPILMSIATAEYQITPATDLAIIVMAGINTNNKQNTHYIAVIKNLIDPIFINNPSKRSTDARKYYQRRTSPNSGSMVNDGHDPLIYAIMQSYNHHAKDSYHGEHNTPLDPNH